MFLHCYNNINAVIFSKCMLHDKNRKIHLKETKVNSQCLINIILFIIISFKLTTYMIKYSMNYNIV